MKVKGSFRPVFANEGPNSASVVFQSAAIGEMCVATNLSNPAARELSFNLNVTMSEGE